MIVTLDHKVDVEMPDETAHRLMEWLQVNTDFTMSLTEIEDMSRASEAKPVPAPKKAKKKR